MLCINAKMVLKFQISKTALEWLHSLARLSDESMLIHVRPYQLFCILSFWRAFSSILGIFYLNKP